MSLLGAVSVRGLEDQVVRTIDEKLHETGHAKTPPVRLSRIADHFLIRPTPEFIPGKHDGELTFDPDSGLFTIKLCCENPHFVGDELPKLPRLRFTYAHEMAHRFFFIRDSHRWVRAIDLVLSRLGKPEAMKQRITLGRIEEGVCNNIARRILIPEHLLSAYGELAEWLDAGSGFFRVLSKVAREFRVSIDCLLVRLQRGVSKNEIAFRNSNCVFVVSSSRGPITRRGQRKVRVSTMILPSSIGDFTLKKIYPGMEFENFGPEPCRFVGSLLEDGVPSLGGGRQYLSLHGTRDGKKVVGTFQFDGWWRLISPKETDEGRRIILWGKLAQMMEEPSAD